MRNLNTMKLRIILLAAIAVSTVGHADNGEPGAEAEVAVAMEEGVPGGVIVNTLEIHAKVVAIDYDFRELALLMPGGAIRIVSVGPEAINFNEIRKGDTVEAVLTEEIIVGMGSDHSELADGEEVVAIGAPKGTMPGGIVIDTVRATATVTALDGEARTATLKFADGSMKVVAVRDDIDLTKHRLGEKVVFEITEMVAISVEKQEKVKPGIVPLPADDAGAKIMRFDGVNAQRYTEIFLIGGNLATKELKAGIYNTVGLNDPQGTGDTCPQVILDQVDTKTLAKQNKLIGTFKNGPRLWTLDWLDVLVGRERNLQGLHTRWVMWLDVPKQLGQNQDKLAYQKMTGKRDTKMGINKGTRVYLLDDPEGNTYCMKSAGLIIDPQQTYVSLKDLGSRLKPAPGWTFRTKILDQDLILTPNNGQAIICQDELGNTYDRVGGPYSNYKP